MQACNFKICLNTLEVENSDSNIGLKNEKKDNGLKSEKNDDGSGEEKSITHFSLGLDNMSVSVTADNMSVSTTEDVSVHSSAVDSNGSSAIPVEVNADHEDEFDGNSGDYSDRNLSYTVSTEITTLYDYSWA